MADAGCVKACTGSDTLVEGDVAEEAHPDARRGSVADAHLTDAQDVAAFGIAVIAEVGTDVDGAVELFGRHGWFVEEVAGATGHLAVDDAFHACEVVIYTDIDDAQLEAVLTTEHVDSAATMGEVQHLLPRHFSRTDTHAFMFDAVVASQQQMAGVAEVWRQGLLHKAYLLGQRLQPSERTFRLVQIVNLVADGRQDGCVRTLDVEGSHLIFISMPDTMKYTSSARWAMYWFIQPCRSVKVR